MNDFNYPRQSNSIKSWIMRKYFYISSNKKSLFDFFLSEMALVVFNIAGMRLGLCRTSDVTWTSWRFKSPENWPFVEAWSGYQLKEYQSPRITTHLCAKLTEPMGERWIPLKWPPMSWVCPWHDDIMGGLCIHCYLHGTAMVHSNGRLPCCLSYPKVGI